MHGQPPHNPLSAAAREVAAMAREAKSPLFERVAIWTMMGSALTTAAIGLVQMWHMIRRDLKDERREKERERERRPDAASPPPPGRPGVGGAATAGMPHDGRDDEQRRWTRRAEQAEA